MTARFQDRQALVTGGTSGIGSAVVSSLADQGCRVVATRLDSDRTEETETSNPSVRTVVLDVRNAASIGRLAEEIKRLDILVNCAGIILRENREFAMEGFHEVIDVNLHGTMRMCSAFRRHLFESRGSVVNIASLYSVFGAQHAPAYSASKGGIVQLTKSLAVTWAEAGVRVNAVMPGWIETPFTESVRANSEKNQAILRRTPLNRWGTAQEVAQAVSFLCSDEASFITGAVLPVDGGYSAM